MPIYEYACGKCETEFEVEQRITEDPVKTCPSCRSRRVKRLISKTSFVLKGGGWYSDLYSSAQGKKAESGEKSDSAASTDEKGAAKSGDSAKSDGAKSDAKSDGAKSSGEKKSKGDGAKKGKGRGKAVA